MSLIDFNPVGGTTAPLLFGDWATLGYDFAAPAEPHPQRAAAAAAGTDATAGPGVLSMRYVVASAVTLRDASCCAYK